MSMPQQNAYIQIEIKNGMAYAHLYPAKDGGAAFNYSEIVTYLNEHDIKVYDDALLRKSLSEAQEKVILLCPYAGVEFTEAMYIKVSLDRMKVTCRFAPPSLGGNLLNIKDILADLKRINVIYGIDQDAISSFMNDRCYATDYVFAKGKPPVIGHDGKIEYLFNTNPSLKPKYNPDGTVDYKNLNTINECKKGQVIARLIPADPGAPGKDVAGRDIPTRSVKSVVLEGGKNMAISEDKTEIISTVDGHVTLTNNKLFVSEVYEVPADVDNSTGNIEFNGNVHVNGNVKGGFTVIAKGDVIIDGVVEDALVQAGGQIIVKRGIHGMARGVLSAKGNIIIAFIENARVFSEGYIETGSIIYSEVNAAEYVRVIDHKGFIVGGVIRAGSKVESNIIGSDMGASTKIEVGMAPEKKQRYNQLKNQINDLNQRIDRLNPIIDTYNNYVASGMEFDEKNAVYLHKLLNEMQTLKDSLQKCRSQYNSLHQELLMSIHSKVVIRRDIYPGVTITISDLTLTTKDKRSYCQYEKKDGEIRFSALAQ